MFSQLKKLPLKRLLTLVGLIIGLILIGYLSKWFLWADNPVEQAIEGVIEDKTGIEIDLSP